MHPGEIIQFNLTEMRSNYTKNNSIYLLNGIDLATLGITVEEAGTGFLTLPPRNPGTQNNLPGIGFLPRKPQITFKVSGDNYFDLQIKINMLYNQLSKPGLLYLKIAGIPKLYLVYVNDEVIPEHYSIDSVGCSVHITVNFIEPYPFTRQFYTQLDETLQVEFQFNSTKPVIIDWGDGTSSIAPIGESIGHEYDENGTYAIVVYGDIDGVNSISPTGAIDINSLYFPGSVGMGVWNDGALWDDGAPWRDYPI
jgi:hypothetical protein